MKVPIVPVVPSLGSSRLRIDGDFTFANLRLAVSYFQSAREDINEAETRAKGETDQ
jgi:hypothetical protein